MDFLTNSDGKKEMKAVFNIASQNNPLMIYPNQSLIQELQEDSNQRTFFMVQDFHTSFASGNMAQFTYNTKKNQEISILVEGSIGYYNNNKLQTNFVASIFPDFINQANGETFFRMNGTQLTGIPLVQRPYIKVSFVIRDITNTQEDNNFSYRLVNFDNVYSLIFGLY